MPSPAQHHQSSILIPHYCGNILKPPHPPPSTPTLSLASALLLAPLASSTSLTLLIPSSSHLPNPSTLPPSTHAVLTSHNTTLTALLTKRNTLHFAHVPAGSYLCDVYTRDHHVAPLRVDVRVPAAEAARGERPGWETGDIEVWQTFRGNDWANRGEKLREGRGECEVNVGVVGSKKFFEERQGCELLDPPSSSSGIGARAGEIGRECAVGRPLADQGTVSPLSLLQSPMILLGIVGMGVMIGMPKLMENSEW
jgi:hypothetical protein